jgi:hypothetical protein
MLDIGRLAAAALLSIDCALAAPAQIAGSATEAQQQAWVLQAAADLPPRALATLQRIAGADRRLLAVRAYLRAGSSLDERWSWSQQQLDAYPSIPEARAAAADIDAVIAAFSAANPGFTLQVNRLPRSLEVQIAHWNDNKSVAIAAAALAASLERQFGASAGAPDTAALRAALMQWQPPVAATLAAPGLSAHGQARAFDFQVQRDGKVIAGIESASARQRWDAAGWTQKLRAAVASAGNRFAGPLASPYEPWHYAWIAPKPGGRDP